MLDSGTRGQVETPQPVKSTVEMSGVKIPHEQLARATTPEQSIKVVEPTKPAFDLLKGSVVDSVVKTIEFHNRLAGNPLPAGSFHESFLAYFQKAFPEADLSNPDVVRDCADQFLKKGVNVRLAMELLEWEAATLQARSGVHFELRQKASKSTNRIKATLSPDQGYSSYVVDKSNFIARLLRKTANKYDIVLDDNLGASGLLDADQKAFLAEWPTYGSAGGAITDTQRMAIANRLDVIAGLRTEMYFATGMTDVRNIEFNFIGKGGIADRVYLGAASRIQHFHGETTSTGDIKEAITKEMGAIAAEESAKINKTLKEKLEANNNNTLGVNKKESLLASAADDEKDKILDPEAQAIKQAEQQRIIDTETTTIADLKKYIELQENLPKVDQEIGSMEDELKLMSLSLGLSENDLLTWGDESSGNSDSVYQMEARLAELKGKATPFREKIKSIEEDMREHKANERRIAISRPNIDTKLAQAIGQIESSDFEPTWLAAQNKLESSLADAKKELSDLKEGAQSLLKAESDLKGPIEKRKFYIERDDVKAKLADLKQKRLEKLRSERAINKLKTKLASENVDDSDSERMRKNVEAKVLEHGKNKIKAEEEQKKLGVNEEKERTANAKTGLSTVFSPEGKREWEQRFATTEQMRANKVDDEVWFYDKEWGKYPPVMLKLVQTLYGPEVLGRNPPNADLVKQVHALLETSGYLKIVVGAIEDGANVDPAKKITIAADLSKITPDEFANLIANSPFKDLAIQDLSKDTILAILDSLYKDMTNMIGYSSKKASTPVASPPAPTGGVAIPPVAPPTPPPAPTASTVVIPPAPSITSGPTTASMPAAQPLTIPPPPIPTPAPGARPLKSVFIPPPASSASPPPSPPSAPVETQSNLSPPGRPPPGTPGNPTTQLGDDF